MFAFLSPFPIRERLWYNLGKLFNNTSAFDKEKATRNEERKKMRETESAFFCEQRQMHQSAPLLKNRSHSLVVFFIRKMKRAN